MSSVLLSALKTVTLVVDQLRATMGSSLKYLRNRHSEMLLPNASMFTWDDQVDVIKFLLHTQRPTLRQVIMLGVLEV